MKSTHRYALGSGSILSTDHLIDRNILKSGYFKNDDEFYYDLDPDSIVEARMERWPRSPRPDEHEEYFVTMSTTGTVLLVLVLVDDEKFYYRKSLNWVYIGPGDNVPGFEEHELIAVSQRIIDYFDHTEYSEFNLIEESIRIMRI